MRLYEKYRPKSIDDVDWCYNSTCYHQTKDQRGGTHRDRPSHAQHAARSSSNEIRGEENTALVAVVMPHRQHGMRRRVGRLIASSAGSDLRLPHAGQTPSSALACVKTAGLRRLMPPQTEIGGEAGAKASHTSSSADATCTVSLRRGSLGGPFDPARWYTTKTGTDGTTRRKTWRCFHLRAFMLPFIAQRIESATFQAADESTSQRACVKCTGGDSAMPFDNCRAMLVDVEDGCMLKA